MLPDVFNSYKFHEKYSFILAAALGEDGKKDKTSCNAFHPVAHKFVQLHE